MGVDELLAAGRAAWPEIDLARERFAAYLGGLGRDGPPDEERGPELYLVCACLAGDGQALAAFDRRYLAQLAGFLHRIDASAPFVEEVRQILRVRLLVDDGERAPRLADYTGRGALASWLRVVAIRAALDLKRARIDRPCDDAEIEALAGAPARQDPEMDYIRTRYAAEFRAAIGTAMTELEPRERTLLRLGLVDGLTADQIAGVYGVHRVTVARWLAAAREHLAGRCQRRLEERLHLGPTELRSLLGLVRSQLDLSVRRLLSVRERVE